MERIQKKTTLSPYQRIITGQHAVINVCIVSRLMSGPSERRSEHALYSTELLGFWTFWEEPG
jgi:hypothetical protein